MLVLEKKTCLLYLTIIKENFQKVISNLLTIQFRLQEK